MQHAWIALWITTTIPALAGCAHWQARPAQVSRAGSAVKVQEQGPAPADCKLLGEVSAKRGPLQNEERLEVDLRDSAAAMHANLVVVTQRTTLTVKGQALACPVAPTAAAPAQPPAAPPAPSVQPVQVMHSGAPAAPQAGDLEEVALDQRAHELFVSGRDAYLAQHYEPALRYFKAAYQLSGRYELQFNIGQAADRVNRLREALEAFEAYLAEAPPGPHRTQVEARVAVLRSTL